MKLVTIDQENHDVLRRPAKRVTFPLSASINALLDEMEAFIKTLESLAGLAATQVGHSQQIIFVNIPPEAKEHRKDVYDAVPLTPFINPSFKPIEKEGKTKDWEACFSVPDKMGEVWRFNAIHFEAMTREGEKVSREVRGFFARLLQHEIGHLNGEVYTDLIGEDCRFGSVEEMTAIRKAELPTPEETDSAACN